MSSTIFTRLLVALTVNKSTRALPEFANKIPNGFSVPNPDPQGGVLAGVGHLNAGGGGNRNPFGEDFKVQGYDWTKVLCETDSDGGGRSNGIELGDGDCEWVAGGPDQPQGPALSHPGIVDVPKDLTTVSSCDTYNPPEYEEIVDVVFSAPNAFDDFQWCIVAESPSVGKLHPSSQSLFQRLILIVECEPECLFP
jgi:dopamine beta-monooxygenase